ncbi:MAG: hypothetical protein HY782_18075 [Chloroflexi bacterium]|nr:hypothetical protein [Chloroflexota bacterium]
MLDQKERTERARKRPYFIWDYDLTEEDVRAILRGDNEYEKLWVMVRILERCRLEEIWSYVTPAQLRQYWPQIHRRIRKELRGAWEWAMEVWYGIVA